MICLDGAEKLLSDLPEPWSTYYENGLLSAKNAISVIALRLASDAGLTPEEISARTTEFENRACEMATAWLDGEAAAEKRPQLSMVVRRQLERYASARLRMEKVFEGYASSAQVPKGDLN